MRRDALPIRVRAREGTLLAGIVLPEQIAAVVEDGEGVVLSLRSGRELRVCGTVEAWGARLQWSTPAELARLEAATRGPGGKA